MERLKLFPLNTVLFPGGVLPLRIFEPRYRQMVADCLESDRRFGLIFHDVEHSGPYHSEPGLVGCIAEIEQVQPLKDGRSLIVTRGTKRFRIEEPLRSDAAYDEALAEEYRDESPPSPDIRERRMRVISLFNAVLDILPELPGGRPEIDLAGDLSFRLASLLQVDPAWMQTLLESRDEGERLDLLSEFFRAVIAGGLGGNA